MALSLKPAHIPLRPYPGCILFFKTHMDLRTPPNVASEIISVSYSVLVDGKHQISRKGGHRQVSFLVPTKPSTHFQVLSLPILQSPQSAQRSRNASINLIQPADRIYWNIEWESSGPLFCPASRLCLYIISSDKLHSLNLFCIQMMASSS